MLEEDHVTLKKRLLCEEFDTENYPNVIRIFGKKAQVDKFNKLCQKKLSSRIHTHPAEHYFSKQDFHPGASVSEDMIPDDDRDAGNLVRNLQLAMGSRVMLTQNINTEDSLVNGAIGIMEPLE